MRLIACTRSSVAPGWSMRAVSPGARPPGELAGAIIEQPAMEIAARTASEAAVRRVAVFFMVFLTVRLGPGRGIMAACAFIPVNAAILHCWSRPRPLWFWKSLVAALCGKLGAKVLTPAQGRGTRHG